MVPAKYNYFERLVIIAPVRSSLSRFRTEIPLIPAVQIPQTTSFLIITNRQELNFNATARNSELLICIFMTCGVKQAVGFAR